MKQFELNNLPHRRKNILTGEWVLVSPQRTKRPWKGEMAEPEAEQRKPYEPECYLCPGNKRANGEVNPKYESIFAFTNDYPSLVENVPERIYNKKSLLVAKGESGICRVINFSPRHDLTLAEMDVNDIANVVSAWREEFKNLGSNPEINYVQIFENKGALMGNSNPHPHCQIWAQKSIPVEPAKELKQFRKYYRQNRTTILNDYLKLELKLNERIVYKNDSFVVFVPFWAVWPFECLIVSKRKISTILQFKRKEEIDFADAIKILTTKYDNLFKTSFPYSSGIHQAPTDGKEYKEWHFHMHFYPPLLRSASIKKFMVGYEMLSEPQRDVTAELSAKVLRELPDIHYRTKMKTDLNIS